MSAEDENDPMTAGQIIERAGGIEAFLERRRVGATEMKTKDRLYAIDRDLHNLVRQAESEYGVPPGMLAKELYRSLTALDRMQHKIYVERLLVPQSKRPTEPKTDEETQL